MTSALRELNFLTASPTAWPVGVEAVLDYNSGAVVMNDLRRADRIIVTSIGGLSGPDLQAGAEKNPDRDGEQMLEATYGGRTITLRGYVEAGNRDKLRSLYSYLLDGFDDVSAEAPLWFRWLDWREPFTDSLALIDYAYDAGTGTVQVAADGSGLQPTTTANKEIRILPLAPDGTSPSRLTYGDGETIVKFRVATSFTGLKVGAMLRRTSSTQKLRCYYDKATNLLILEKVVAGTPSTLASVAVSTLTTATDYWISVRAEGLVLTSTIWSTYPPDTGTTGSIATVSYTLAGGETSQFPASTSGLGWGLYWTPNSTLDKVGLLDVGAINPGDGVIWCRKSVQIEGEEAQTDFGWRRDFLLTLRSSDARMVSRKAARVTITPPGSPTLQTYYSTSLTNYGRSPAEMLVRFNGTYFNPRIYLPASGKLLGLQANVGNNDGVHVNTDPYGGYFELDTNDRTVVYDSVPSAVYEALSSDSTWPQLARGSNELRITADKFDDFYNASAASALNARTSAPSSMGTWATSGSTTDFTASTTTSWGDSTVSESRATTSDTGSGRFAVLGTTNFTDATVRLIFKFTVVPSTAGTQRISILARYTNTTNYLTVAIIRNAVGYYINVTKVVAGVTVSLNDQPIIAGLSANTWYELSFTIRSNGRWMVELIDPATGSFILTQSDSYGDIDTASTWVLNHADLVTGTGTLGTGKIGILDFNPTATANTRYYGRILTRTAIDAGTISLYYRHSSR